MKLLLLITLIWIIKSEDLYTLDLQSRNDFRNRMKEFQKDPLFDKYVSIHVDYFDTFHSSNTLFFSFHDMYVDLYENISGIEVHYWNFSSTPFSTMIKDFGGYKTFCGGHVCYTRSFRTSKTQLEPIDTSIHELEDLTIHIRDNQHNQIHQFVGGTFQTPYSPRDIIFYPFHKYINILYRTLINETVYLQRKQEVSYIYENFFTDPDV
jgi:hypothetical protein